MHQKVSAGGLLSPSVHPLGLCAKYYSCPLREVKIVLLSLKALKKQCSAPETCLNQGASDAQDL